MTNMTGEVQDLVPCTPPPPPPGAPPPPPGTTPPPPPAVPGEPAPGTGAATAAPAQASTATRKPVLEPVFEFAREQQGGVLRGTTANVGPGATATIDGERPAPRPRRCPAQASRQRAAAAVGAHHRRDGKHDDPRHPEPGRTARGGSPQAADPLDQRNGPRIAGGRRQREQHPARHARGRRQAAAATGDGRRAQHVLHTARRADPAWRHDRLDLGDPTGCRTTSRDPASRARSSRKGPTSGRSPQPARSPTSAPCTTACGARSPSADRMPRARPGRGAPPRRRAERRSRARPWEPWRHGACGALNGLAAPGRRPGAARSFPSGEGLRSAQQDLRDDLAARPRAGRKRRRQRVALTGANGSLEANQRGLAGRDDLTGRDRATGRDPDADRAARRGHPPDRAVIVRRRGGRAGR